MSDNWKNQFDNATVNSSSVYMEPGEYLIRIDAIKRGANRKGQGNFKLEGTIVHQFQGENHGVGVSVCDMYSEASDFFFSEVKGMIAGIAGKPSADVTYDDLLNLSSDSQPLKGIVVEYSAWSKDTQSGGKITKKQCKGMKTEAEFRDVASEEEVTRFIDGLRFKKAAAPDTEKK